MTREKCIYVLTDNQGRTGYVGSTTVNMKTRLWEHRSRARKNHPAPVYDWIRSVGVDNINIEKLENPTPDDDLAAREAFWIKTLLDAGEPIQNQIARDGVPNSNGDRMKQILSQKKKGKPTWIKGKKGLEAGWTEERKEKLRQMVYARFAQSN